MDEPVFNPFQSGEITPAYSEHWKAKRRVAQALRELTATCQALFVRPAAGMQNLR